MKRVVRAAISCAPWRARRQAQGARPGPPAPPPTRTHLRLRVSLVALEAVLLDDLELDSNQSSRHHVLLLVVG